MNIHDPITLILQEVIWKENTLLPANNEVLAKEFLLYYQTGNFDELALVCNEETRITIALCTLNERETWERAAKSDALKTSGWSGASLALWKLYVQGKSASLKESVILPGLLYLADDMTQWVPVVHHRPVISILGDLRGSETKVSMRSLSILNHIPETGNGVAKISTVLISKKETIKT